MPMQIIDFIMTMSVLILGIDECPQCKAAFDGSSCRPVQDSCGHFKCRVCFISNEVGCPQCLVSNNRTQGKKQFICIKGNLNDFTN